ncbi:MAG TPA: hypothetical protein VFI30_07860 [Nocardioidaceae bacterium]|nr:hypothetical protein [Nocardioidaceae bacterium]
MRFAPLATGVVAALMGAYLLFTWLANGGLRHAHGDQASSRFAPPLIFGHAGLAATGLAAWVAYLALGRTAIGWSSLGVLTGAASLGATMFGLWLRTQRLHGRHLAGPRHRAEDHFPPPVVVGHGMFAVSTVALVLATVLLSAR